MKEFSHPGKAGSAPADLNQALRTTLTVSRNEYRHLADVETDLQELPPVWCQLGDLNQVFLNLIVNAAHAIEEAGRGKGVIRIVSRVAHGAVTISIGDNGSGMPDSIRDRIFDPFFTTKPIGKGTGQGLAIVRSVVEQHAGEIHVDSLPGRGTTFTIRIPVDARGLERAIVNERIVSHG